MTNPDETQSMLEGLDLGDPRTYGVMRASVVATITALKTDGLVEPRHAAIMQLALELADAVERAGRSSKPYGVALVAGQLRDTLLALPAPPDAEVNQKFEAALEKYLAGGDSS